MSFLMSQMVLPISDWNLAVIGRKNMDWEWFCTANASWKSGRQAMPFVGVRQTEMGRILPDRTGDGTGALAKNPGGNSGREERLRLSRRRWVFQRRGHDGLVAV